MSYVDGEWINADDGSSSEILNPATSESLGFVPNCGSSETTAAIEAAIEAQKIWSKTDAKERSSVLKNLHRLMLENQEDLAKIIGKRTMELAEECGKKSLTENPLKNLADEKCNLYMDHGPSMTRIIQQHMIDEIGQKWKSCSENKSAKNGKESWKDILDKEKFELRLTYSKYFQSSTQFYNPN